MIDDQDRPKPDADERDKEPTPKIPPAKQRRDESAGEQQQQQQQQRQQDDSAGGGPMWGDPPDW